MQPAARLSGERSCSPCQRKHPGSSPGAARGS